MKALMITAKMRLIRKKEPIIMRKMKIKAAKNGN